MSNTNNMQTQTSSALHNAIMEAGGKDRPPMQAPAPETPITDGTNRGNQTRAERVKESYATVLEEIRKKMDVEAEVVQIILTGIDNDIYSTVDACPNAIEMRKAIERLKHEWKRFVTIIKHNQDLKNVPYHKLYDILKQHQNEFNEIRDERLARTANPLALVISA
ncbi:hypothetical protein Tco_1559367 [Tanacetum coccineum]